MPMHRLQNDFNIASQAGVTLTIPGAVVMSGSVTHSGANTFSAATTFTGTVTITDVNVALSTSTGTKIGTTSSQKLGFWGAAPVAQQSTTGTASGFTAGAGTAVKDDSTFTGNSGSTAYRISDVVLALKNVGILAA